MRMVHLHCRNLIGHIYKRIWGLPWLLSGEESGADAGDTGSIPGLGRSPGGGNSNLLQYSCLRNPTNRGAWQAIVHGVAKKSDTT